jgi:hypothetical protein
MAMLTRQSSASGIFKADASDAASDDEMRDLTPDSGVLVMDG